MFDIKMKRQTIICRFFIIIKKDVLEMGKGNIV